MTVLFLIAAVAGRTVAIDALYVDAVVDIAEIVPIPRAAPEIVGLAALRSRVVTVIDTARTLGLPAAGGAARAITTRIDGHGYGFLVDSVDDVAAFEPQPLAMGLALDAGWRRAARGLIERDGEAILILDLAALAPLPVAAAA